MLYAVMALLASFIDLVESRGLFGRVMHDSSLLVFCYCHESS